MSTAAAKSNSTTVIKGGTIVDATGSRSGDVVLAGDMVVGVGPDLSGDRILDAGGCLIAPGLVDLGVRTGEPGNEEAETIESVTRAAALGGFTAVVALPDTDPVIDNASIARDISARSAGALCDVFPAGAITVGLHGERLAPLQELAAIGVRVFTDAGRTIADAGLLRRIMEYASTLDVTLALDCEDAGLAAGAQMNEGVVSSRLGMPGVPAEAEEIVAMRDVALAGLTGARVHFRCLTTAGSLAIAHAAKAGGLPVTIGSSPHHLSFSDEAVSDYSSRFKLRPPLRTGGDVAALASALAAGWVDALSTDHHSHTQEAKESTFEDALWGSSGLETALAQALTFSGSPPDSVLRALSWGPAAIAGISHRHGGTIAEGHAANLCVFDPNATWTVGERPMATRRSSCAADGVKLTGLIRHTVLAGEAVVVDGEATR